LKVKGSGARIIAVRRLSNSSKLIQPIFCQTTVPIEVEAV